MARVLCLGLVAADFVLGVESLPRRAEKYRAGSARLDIGGAARMASAVAALGGEAMLAGRIGDDDLGTLLCARLAARGDDCRALHSVGGATTPFTSILVDGAGERQIVNYRDAALHGDAAGLAPHLDGVDAILSDTRWPAGAAAAMRRARSAAVPGVIDGEAPTDIARTALAAASHVVFSRQGLRDFLGGSDDIAAADAQLSGLVAVTEGEAGVRWRAGEETYRAAGFAVTARDSLGAGDVWHAAFALALAEDQGVAPAMRFANAAGALAVSRAGGPDGLPDRDAVSALLARGETKRSGAEDGKGD